MVTQQGELYLIVVSLAASRSKSAVLSSWYK
jgi:hypothetical protein